VGSASSPSASASSAPAGRSWRPERVGPAEIVVVLTKTTDTEAALAGLDHVRDAVRLAVSLQNGVEKDGVLASLRQSVARLDISTPA